MGLWLLCTVVCVLTHCCRRPQRQVCNGAAVLDSAFLVDRRRHGVSLMVHARCSTLDSPVLQLHCQRTAPHNSWTNPVEKIMAILNVGAL